MPERLAGERDAVGWAGFANRIAGDDGDGYRVGNKLPTPADFTLHRFRVTVPPPSTSSYPVTKYRRLSGRIRHFSLQKEESQNNETLFEAAVGACLCAHVRMCKQPGQR